MARHRAGHDACAVRRAATPDNLQQQLLNALDTTVGWYWVSRRGDHWAQAAFGTYEVRMKAPVLREPFLSLATKFGITAYVVQELQARVAEAVVNVEEGDDHEVDEEREGVPTPLLAYATEYLCSRNKTIYPLSDRTLVDFLLRHLSAVNPGPNEVYSSFVRRKPVTPWLVVLQHLRDAKRRGWIEQYDTDPAGTERWVSIVRDFMVVGGADVKTVIPADQWDPEITAIGVMEMLEETYGSWEVRELRREMAMSKEAEQDHTDVPTSS